MQLTRSGEYGIRGILYLALQSPERLTSLEAIAQAQDVPKNLLAKVMQNLAKAGIVRSQRGAGGGFALARPASAITLLQVIQGVEGPLYLNRCLIRRGECPYDQICPVHKVWRRAQEALVAILGGTTIAKLVEEAPYSLRKGESR